MIEVQLEGEITVEHVEDGKRVIDDVRFTQATVISVRLKGCEGPISIPVNRLHFGREVIMLGADISDGE